jgi:hypothetical protein
MAKAGLVLHPAFSMSVQTINRKMQILEPLQGDEKKKARKQGKKIYLIFGSRFIDFGCPIIHKIRKYRADYNNNPPNAVAFMPAIACTTGRLHSEFIRLLFLQAHRETDRFFVASGV